MPTSQSICRRFIDFYYVPGGTDLTSKKNAFTVHQDTDLSDWQLFPRLCRLVVFIRDNEAKLVGRKRDQSEHLPRLLLDVTSMLCQNYRISPNRVGCYSAPRQPRAKMWWLLTSIVVKKAPIVKVIFWLNTTRRTPYILARWLPCTKEAFCHPVIWWPTALPCIELMSLLMSNSCFLPLCARWGF